MGSASACGTQRDISQINQIGRDHTGVVGGCMHCNNYRTLYLLVCYQLDLHLLVAFVWKCYFSDFRQQFDRIDFFLYLLGVSVFYRLEHGQEIILERLYAGG